jgi:hypothetical protein
MKNTVRLAIALCALALAAPAAAEQRSQFGFGVSVAPLSALTLGAPVEVYVPIRIAPAFRLEPSLGILTNDPDGDDNNSSNITLGIGAFWVKQLAATADLYAGARLKLNFASQETPVGDESDTDLVLAGALGGEYFFMPKFSLGLEAQLGLYQRGDVSGDDSGFFTNGLVFVRMYF